MLLPPAGVSLPVVSLPVVKTLQDCAEFSRTVSPYVPQLRALPWQVLESISGFDDFKTLYVSTNPLVSSFALSLFLAPIFLVVSEANKNYSQVDRLWSILPSLYNAHYVLWAHMVGLPTQRLNCLLGFSLIWSARLTFNYWRKGGYSIGSEDYRWQVLREKISPPLMFLFNVLFISLAQSVLLWSITTPTYLLTLASRLAGDTLTWADTFFAGGLIALVFFEWLADQQQWNFQNAKKQYQKTAKVPAGYDREDLDRGFFSKRLFSWSRHPNFAVEQAIWVTMYQWAAYETYTYFNWTFIGPMAYLLLFQASTWFTELISAGKYPEYKEYQQRVGKFLPKLLNGNAQDVGDRKAQATKRAQPPTKRR